MDQHYQQSLIDDQPMTTKRELQTFTSTCGTTRYTFYETWFNKRIAIVEEHFWEDVWSIKCSMSVPKEVFSMLEYESRAGSAMPNIIADHNVEMPISTTIIHDRFDLPTNVREVLFQMDCQNIPLSENQLGYMSDLETLESYWDFRTSPASPNEGTKLLSPEMERRPNQFACETPIKPKPSSQECPPAPKKLKRSQHKKADFSWVQLDLTDL